MVNTFNKDVKVGIVGHCIFLGYQLNRIFAFIHKLGLQYADGARLGGSVNIKLGLAAGFNLTLSLEESNLGHVVSIDLKRNSDYFT